METTTRPKFLVRCNCEEFYACGDEHVEPGMVAAHCDECDEPAVIEFTEGHFLCESHLRPCWKCGGPGCSACGETGGEAVRRSLQSRAELPAFSGTWMGRVAAGVDEETTERIAPETMKQAVSR